MAPNSSGIYATYIGFFEEINVYFFKNANLRV